MVCIAAYVYSGDKFTIGGEDLTAYVVYVKINQIENGGTLLSQFDFESSHRNDIGM